jgi:hypothetical protein
MKYRRIGLPIALVIAASVQAQSAQVAPIELWNGFTTASTKTEIEAFRAVKPKRQVEVFPGCMADMGHRHSDGKLVTIIILGLARDSNCFSRVYSDLRRDHGNPETKGTTIDSVIGYGSNGSAIDTISAGTLLIWRQREKKTMLVRIPGKGYNLIFTVRMGKFDY